MGYELDIAVVRVAQASAITGRAVVAASGRRPQAKDKVDFGCAFSASVPVPQNKRTFFRYLVAMTRQWRTQGVSMTICLSAEHLGVR